MSTARGPAPKPATSLQPKLDPPAQPLVPAQALSRPRIERPLRLPHLQSPVTEHDPRARAAIVRRACPRRLRLRRVVHDPAWLSQQHVPDIQGQDPHSRDLERVLKVVTPSVSRNGWLRPSRGRGARTPPGCVP